jgi:PKD repeat protein
MKVFSYCISIFWIAFFIIYKPSSALAQTYCYPSVTGCSAGDSIAYFQFGSYVRVSNCSSGGLDTSQTGTSVITVYRGKSYGLTIISKQPGKYDEMGAWIDFNKNGSFADLGEMIGLDNNGNGLIGSYSTSVLIPINATPQTTRMRVMVTYGNGSKALDYNTTCSSFGVGGETEDYAITIAAYNHDIGIVALNSPQNLSCPSTKAKVQVIFTNYGLNSETNIPFYLKLGTTTISNTYTRTIAPTATDTFTIGYINASTSGAYNLKVYSGMTIDNDRTDDTLIAAVNLAQAATPKIKDTVKHCGPAFGIYLPGASTTSNSSTYWFANDTTQKVLAKGDSLKASYLGSGTATYFAESRFTNNYVLVKSAFSTARANKGNFFEIFSKRTLTIDSFDVNFSSTSTDSANIYYRKGTYFGFERTQSAWTKLTEILVNGKGGGNATRVPLPKGSTITLQPGITYGFYIESLAGVNYDTTGTSHIYSSNNDMTIKAGSAVADLFAKTGSVAVGRDWDGIVYYHIPPPCNSPRISTTIDVLPSPNGSNVYKGVPFEGQFNAGDISSPDNICLGDTNTYQISAPKGFSNSDYGKSWTISGFSFKTARGTTIKDTFYRAPTSTKNAAYIISPKSDADSVFIMRFIIRTLPYYCDSVVIRYIHIRVYPTAAFTFKNSCLGTPISFSDSSSIALGKVNIWSWDFGDGNTGTGQTVSHSYASAGTYKVIYTAGTDVGCSRSISKTVEQYALPKAKFVSIAQCNKDTARFIDSSTISSSKIVSWKWNFGDGTNSSLQNPKHVYSASGPYNIKLIEKSSFGCSDSTIKKITILSKPRAVFAYKDDCVGNPIYYSNTSVDSTNASNNLWSFGDGTTSTTGSPAHSFKSNGTYKTTLKVTSKAGCTDTVSQFITPYPVPVVKITYTPACAGKPIAFVDSSGTGNGAQYNWTFGDGNTGFAKVPAISHTYTKAGPFSVSLTISNLSGCTDSQRVNITIPGYPKAGFTTSDICIGKTAVFNNTSTGNDTTKSFWYFGDNTSIENKLNPKHNYKTAGQFDVKLGVANTFGCADTARGIINIHTLPVIDKWTRDQKGYSITFIPKDSTMGNFKWYFGTNTKDSSSKKSPTFVYPTGDEKYVVKVVVTDANGCSSFRQDSVYMGKYGIELPGNTLGGVTVFPNPFKGSTNISYNLTEKSNIDISVYDAQGRQVAQLRKGTFQSGFYIDEFDAEKYHASSGIYILKISVNDRYYAGRIVNMK